MTFRSALRSLDRNVLSMPLRALYSVIATAVTLHASIAGVGAGAVLAD